ncbi:MAG: SpoIVB peptidase [Clostridia bacterium]|nr:SpoIVB peptidase [Clostridia bacterium]
MYTSKTNRVVIFCILCVLFLIIAISYPYDVIATLGSNNCITKEELCKLQKNGLFYATELCRVDAKSDTDNFDEYILKYKLFNLFNITNLRVNVLQDDEIYAGGNCLGFSIGSKGVVVVGSNFIITKDGAVSPFAISGLKIGDIITHIDNIEINDVGDVNNYLLTYSSGEIQLKVNRNGQLKTINITPVLDLQSNTYKIGLWLKSDASGIGTLTFVNETTGRFGSLGHAITNSSNQVFDITGGDIYEANVIGVKKGQMGSPGELLGIFNTTNSQGNVDKNTNFGVFGSVTQDNTLSENKQTTNIGGRLTVKPGKAQILSTIDGYNIEAFDIEIIKTNFQNLAEEKSMVLRVIDKRLLDKTGGIVQGMSGSPIIQDGKLVGAVTHVFVNDPTKGFGIYIDWMLNT